MDKIRNIINRIARFGAIFFLLFSIIQAVMGQTYSCTEALYEMGKSFFGISFIFAIFSILCCLICAVTKDYNHEQANATEKKGDLADICISLFSFMAVWYTIFFLIPLSQLINNLIYPMGTLSCNLIVFKSNLFYFLFYIALTLIFSFIRNKRNKANNKNGDNNSPKNPS